MAAIDENERLAGDSVIVVGTMTATDTAAVALAEPEVAVTVAVPELTAVTTPDADTVATEALDVAHVTVASLIVAPFWSLTVAVSCCVDPTDEKLKLVGDSVIVVGTMTATDTVAVALAAPEVAVMVAVPTAAAVTAPDDDTVATEALDVVHTTVASLIVVPFWSTTVAVSCCVDPTDEKLKLVGDSVIVVGTNTMTVTDAVALTEPDVAVIVAVPSPTDVTAPDDDTVATAALDVVHVTVGLLIVLPFWSTTVAVSCCVDPTVENGRLVGDSVIVVGIVKVTVTVAVALAAPEVAVTIALPEPTAVTRPDTETVATEEADVAHVTGAPLIVAPFWSMTVAVSWDVSPTDVKLKIVDDNVIDDATGRVTVTDAVAFTEPDVALIIALPAPTDVTAPDDDTVATDASDVVHVTGAPLIVAPFWSLTVAVSCCVDPADVNERFVGDNVIDDATRSIIVMDSVLEVEAPPLVTVTSKLLVPAVVGVPVMAPADERSRPDGKSPAVRDQL